MAAPDGDHSSSNRSGPTNSRGWDGKLRVERRAILTNPEALSDPDYSDEDAPAVEEIAADEGEARLADHKKLPMH